ncbi:na+/solute symporter [Heliomicrobium modesticaldum Ice1]|uniref:Na+/solute symporter n=1 Tax=Heliobacterium modesticaldum (strain ATCC 51547 / Ice1) TaxID=498761 RepID=B0TBH9_HELMI|nr:cation acetate symporter [Heliomicrobium modesticaldum]ABZ85192.1 na+/solute symporter [Heliomicrobium modesticaldum Ice1]
MINIWAIGMVIALIVTTIIVSIMGKRATANTADFYLAGRKVGFFTNASAICGDYFSAASFLGVAAAVYASGLDGAWFAAGFGAAFVPVVLFMASPIRRFGEYTIPDFLFARYGQSHRARIIGVVMVQLISIFYLAPQMVGAGTTWNVLVGQGLFGLSPYATGVWVVVLIMTLYVALGGMKGTTWNQLIQFWVLFTAMILVVIMGIVNGVGYSDSVAKNSEKPLLNPGKVTVAKLMEGEPGKRLYDVNQKNMTPEAFAKVQAVVDKGDPTAEVNILVPQKNKLHPERAMMFNEPGHRYSALDQFSMVLALVLGTAGLPHVMNRYYTNPSGKSARFTTVWVLGFVALFYMMSQYVGAIARQIIPPEVAKDPELMKLTVDGLLLKADQVMPVMGKIFAGEFGLGYVAAGAFAAMFSTIGGLLMASAASWGHDIYENYVNPHAEEWKRVLVGKIAVVGMATLSLLVGLGIPAAGLDKAYPALIAMMVTWAFSVSASAFVPTLLASIWWKKTTEKGALAGMFSGGFGAIFFIVMNILKETKAVAPDSFFATLGTLTFPVLITVPLSFAVIFIVSITDKKLPANVEQIWMRIHGTAAERRERRMQQMVLQPEQK